MPPSQNLVESGAEVWKILWIMPVICISCDLTCEATDSKWTEDVLRFKVVHVN